MRILLVEDDPILGDALVVGLEQCDFVVDWVRDGASADNCLTNSLLYFSALILDLGLPQIGGMEVLRRIRQRKQDIPVLILTARDAKRDKIAGLDSGADDYLLKPFDIDELAARLRALIRRSGGHTTATLSCGEITLQPQSRLAYVNDRELNLSQLEFDILYQLVLKPGQVISHEQLNQSLYGWGEDIESNTLAVHVHHLRRKIANKQIKTIRGIGYKLNEY